jgi:hypothetical protein
VCALTLAAWRLLPFIRTAFDWIDIVVEGDAVMVSDNSTLETVASAFAGKYEPPFNFKARDFAAYGEGGQALVFEVTPRRAFGYGRGERFSATRWRF